MEKFQTFHQSVNPFPVETEEDKQNERLRKIHTFQASFDDFVAYVNQRIEDTKGENMKNVLEFKEYSNGEHLNENDNFFTSSGTNTYAGVCEVKISLRNATSNGMVFVIYYKDNQDINVISTENVDDYLDYWGFPEKAKKQIPAMKVGESSKIANSTWTRIK